MGKKKISYKCKKYSHQGNRFQNKQSTERIVLMDISENEQNRAPPATASSAKLEAADNKNNFIQFDYDQTLTGFRFIDCQLLVSFVSMLLCPSCKEPLGGNAIQSTVKENRTDLASSFHFHCGSKNCEPVTLTTSTKCNRVYEVNRRFPLSMFAIGRHQTQGRRFLGNMNIPNSLNNSTWANHRNQICKATEAVAEASTAVAAEEVRAATGSSDVTVSGDGTYQRRGFQSKNGVFTAISVNGNKSKVVDCEILSNSCDSCKKKEKKLDGEALERWREHHKEKCDKNHTGTAAAMESVGAERVFRRSQEKHGLRYINYLGDGDSKTYTTLKNADIYDVQIKKLECCGHVQKRIHRALTTKTQEMKNKTFTDENGKSVKGIGGKGGLTKKGILRIQGHFGAAIRKNKNNLHQMRKDIWAIFHHRNRNHTDCGQWCPAKKGAGDPDKNALPPHVCTAIRPVFEKLTDESLLQKCLHGGSQNTNESFHNMIWERCPKTVFVGRKRLRVAVADATIAYNDGETGRLDIFSKLGFEPGVYTRLCFQSLDSKRMKKGQIKATDAAKFARQSRAFAEAERNEGDREEYYLAGGHE